MRRLPKTIGILGKTYRIIRRKLKGSYGTIEKDGDRIHITTGITLEVAHQTLLHEVIHGALSRSGHDYRITESDEEAIVRAIENAVWGAGYRLSEE